METTDTNPIETTTTTTTSMLPIDMSTTRRVTIGSLLSSGSIGSSSSSSWSNSSHHNHSQPDLELGERCSSDHDETTTSSSSGADSPDSKPALVVSDGDRTLGVLSCHYLLKQMNKRKLHLPCPLCKSFVVNMSDHLAKTHLIDDFNQRKVNKIDILTFI